MSVFSHSSSYVEPRKLKDLVFFDVETPNRHNDRICAMGAIRVSPSGQVLCSRYWSIKPDTFFDERNVAIHGIRYQDVMNDPNFADLWFEDIRFVFQDANLVAHNAMFDLCVLGKTLAFYGIHLDDVSYICTMEAARRCIPGCPNYKLNTLCEMFGIRLDHHFAYSDTEACMNLFYYMIQHCGMNPQALWARYDFQSLKSSCKSDKAVFALAERARAATAAFPDMVERSVDDLDVCGKVVCLTGSFLHSPGHKKPIEDYLMQKGAAACVKSVTMKCDLLVVGQLGSSRWKHDSYGTKIERAVELAQSGRSGIRLVDEASVIGDDFDDCLSN